MVVVLCDGNAAFLPWFRHAVLLRLLNCDSKLCIPMLVNKWWCAADREEERKLRSPATAIPFQTQAAFIFFLQHLNCL